MKSLKMCRQIQNSRVFHRDFLISNSTVQSGHCREGREDSNKKQYLFYASTRKSQTKTLIRITCDQNRINLAFVEGSIISDPL